MIAEWPMHLLLAVAAKQSIDLLQSTAVAEHPESCRSPGRIFRFQTSGPESKQLVPSQLLAWQAEVTPEVAV